MFLQLCGFSALLIYDNFCHVMFSIINILHDFKFVNKDFCYNCLIIRQFRYFYSIYVYIVLILCYLHQYRNNYRCVFYISNIVFYKRMLTDNCNEISIKKALRLFLSAFFMVFNMIKFIVSLMLFLLHAVYYIFA